MPVCHGYKENPKFDRLKGQALKTAPFFHEVAKDPAYLAFLDKMWAMTGHESVGSTLESNCSNMIDCAVRRRG
jgi:hypothetical protein